MKYVQFLEKAFLIQIIQPYFTNIKKRLVKAPKVYIRDSGVLHFFLGIENKEELFGHPKMGASWEGFVIEQIIANLRIKQVYLFLSHS